MEIIFEIFFEVYAGLMMYIVLEEKAISKKYRILSAYNETLIRLLSVCVFAIWVIVPVAIVPGVILFPFFYVKNCFRWKVRALLKKGFSLKKEKGHKDEFNDNLLEYNEADYRDQDFYDPTKKLVALIAKK